MVGEIAAIDGPSQIATEAAAALGGRIDILVNNAGAARPIAGEVDDAFWEESFTLNFTAARRLTDASSPREGRTLGSGHQRVRRGRRADAQCGGSCQGRAGELVPDAASRARSARITVNTIAPGRINSAQIQRLHPTEQSRADYIRQNIPAGYFGEPYESVISWPSWPLRRPLSFRIPPAACNCAMSTIDGRMAARCGRSN